MTKLKLIFLIIAIYFFVPNIAWASKEMKIYNYNRTIFLPFGDISLKNNYDLISNEWNSVANKDDYANGWLFGSHCVISAKKYHDTNDIKWLKLSEDIMEYYISIFNKYNLFPNRAYQKFEENWVSSMDMPVIALCAELLHELTGKKNYENILNNLIYSMKKKAEDGGFLIEINNSHYWLSEYSDKKINEKNEYYVLNGFFVGLQAILMLDLKLNDPILTDLYKKSFNQYNKIRGDFWISNDIWSYYMLNPKNIIPPHYKIFQKKQLEALLSLSNDPSHKAVYKIELEKHTSALKSALSVFFYSSKAKNHSYDYIMFRAPIHPYLIDIYHTYIEFFDKDGVLISSVDAKNRDYSFKERVFIKGAVSDRAYSYKVWAVYSNGEYYNIYDGDVIISQSSVDYFSQSIEEMKVDFENFTSISSDYKTYHKFNNESDKDANLYIDIPVDKHLLFNDINHSKYFAFEVESKIKNYIQIYLYDSKGNGTLRSYTPLINGRNLILLSLLGFDSLIGDVSKIRIRFNRPIDSINSEFLFNNFLIFQDIYSLYHYINDSNYSINEQF